jgi:hypothetical protein
MPPLMAPTQPAWKEQPKEQVNPPAPEGAEKPEES